MVIHLAFCTMSFLHVCGCSNRATCIAHLRAIQWPQNISFIPGGKKNKSYWDFQNSLNLSSRLPSSAVFQVSVILRWPHMLWPAETPHETVEHVCFLGRGVAVLSLGSLLDQESQPCSGVFPLSKVAGEQGWVACSDEVACELLHCHFPGSSILAPLKRADGYWPNSKWNMPLLTGP